MDMDGKIKVIKSNGGCISGHGCIVINYTDDSLESSGTASATITEGLDYGEVGSWGFNLLFVPPEMRNRGVASRLMSELVKILDEDSIILFNYIEPYGDLDFGQLKCFYKKYGFVEIEKFVGCLIRYPVRL